MLKKLPILLGILSIFIVKSSLALNQSDFMDLKVGDILLQDLNCWSCGLIEEQENSAYSHMGILIKKDNKFYIFEALGKVKLTPVDVFIKRTAKDGHLRVLRSKKNLSLDHLNKVMNKLLSLNLNYDHEFRWNNVDERGETLYCSELVYKVWLKLGLITSLKTKIMSFDVNPLLWDRFFKGDTPRGEIGISPEDFNQAKEFYWIKDIWPTN